MCSIFLCCKLQVKDEGELIEKQKSEIIKIDTTYFSFVRSKKDDTIDISSNLKNKLEKLTKHNSKYTTEKIGRIKKESSIVFKGIWDKPELCLSRKNCYKIRDLKKLEESISEINYARIKINKEGESNPPSKAILEEIIFYSNEDSQTLLNYIKNVRNIEYFWNSIDKSRSDVFRESNKIYFVSRRGQIGYSRNIRLEITELITE